MNEVRLSTEESLKRYKKIISKDKTTPLRFFAEVSERIDTVLESIDLI